MSRSSGPLFSSTTRVKRQVNLPTYDKGEHWSETLDRRPVGKKYGKKYDGPMFAEDRDTYIDNFDNEEITT